MGRRRHTPEQIITALREAEVAQPNPGPGSDQAINSLPQDARTPGTSDGRRTT